MEHKPVHADGLFPEALETAGRNFPDDEERRITNAIRDLNDRLARTHSSLAIEMTTNTGQIMISLLDVETREIIKICSFRSVIKLLDLLVKVCEHLD
ncbi:MAG: flagellar protein FlaG [Candidatus Sumerlaeia bacterium]